MGACSRRRTAAYLTRGGGGLIPAHTTRRIDRGSGSTRRVRDARRDARGGILQRVVRDGDVAVREVVRYLVAADGAEARDLLCSRQRAELSLEIYNDDGCAPPPSLRRSAPACRALRPPPCAGHADRSVARTTERSVTRSRSPTTASAISGLEDADSTRSRGVGRQRKGRLDRAFRAYVVDRRRRVMDPPLPLVDASATLTRPSGAAVGRPTRVRAGASGAGW